MGMFKIITPDGVTDLEDMSAEELLGVYVELMKEDNWMENETKEDEYAVPTWWTNTYGRSNTSYWD